MHIGYARVSKSDGSQSLTAQIDELIAAGVTQQNIYSDQTSGAKDERAGLSACLKALRSGDTLVIWKLDRLGRSVKHLLELLDTLQERDIGLQVISGSGMEMNTATPTGKLLLRLLAIFAEFERDLIRERTMEGLKAARARGRKGGRPVKMTPQKREAIAAMMKAGNLTIGEICAETGVSRSTLYRHLKPNGDTRITLEEK